MKPFDLEAAKRGEPIVRYHEGDGRAAPVTLVGVRMNGLIAVEYNTHSGVTSYHPDDLRMAPKPQMVYLVTWHSCGQLIKHLSCFHYEEEFAKQDVERLQCIHKAATPKITPVEIQP